MADLLPLKPTLGEKYEPAMRIEGQREADEYFEVLVEHALRAGITRDEAEAIERQNLGYFAGYYGADVRARVERLFRCAHPVFGAIAEKGEPSPEEAFDAGIEWARRG